MTPRARAIVLVVIQCVLVSSIAVKYLYERVTCPRVWVRAAQYDPEVPMRGRYLALSPQVDVCGLKPATESRMSQSEWSQTFEVKLVARDGKLVAEDASKKLPRGDYQWVRTSQLTPCNRAASWPAVDYFIPEHARSPFPLQSGQELWVEVTVPPSGPPRPIQLALSDSGKWQVLKFD
jgi:hypothetical protein